MNIENNKQLVRTRFAPSPTGDLHLGGARTALFDYLLAKKYGGQFILRVEDTDTQRNELGKAEEQYQDLIWLGLKPDESPFNKGNYSPYQQTLRLDIYQKYIQKLLAEKKAYYCFCSKEELEKEKQEYLTKEKKANYQYSRKCFQLTSKQIEELLTSQKSYLIRLLIPTGKVYQFTDLVRGEITFQSKDIEDFVLFRSNGIPNFNFACVVDDHLMEISHVLRGEEHLSNTAKQLVLYEFFGWKLPLFGHLSILLNPEGKKFSKRDKDNSRQTIQQLKNLGYLPQAIINYLLFLGWKPESTREIFSLAEATKEFFLAGLNARAAIFSYEKLNWYNGHYIQQLKEGEFKEKTWKILKNHYQLVENQKNYAEEISLLFRPQLNNFQELVALSDYFFLSPIEREKNDLFFPELEQVRELFNKMVVWNEESIKQGLQSLEKKTLPLIRIKLTGRKSGPELVKVIHLLGKEKILERLKNKN